MINQLVQAAIDHYEDPRYLRKVITGLIEKAQPGDTHADLRARTEQAAETAELKGALQFVERWAVHHGTKPHVTAEQALSLIQHYPPIRAITKSYVDGKVPITFNPYAEIAELKAKLAEAVNALKQYDDLIKYTYSGTREAISDLTYAAQNAHGVLLKLLTDEK